MTSRVLTMLVMTQTAVGLAAAVVATYVDLSRFRPLVGGGAFDLSPTMHCTFVLSSAYGSIGALSASMLSILWFLLIALLASRPLRDSQVTCSGCIFVASAVALVPASYQMYGSLAVLRSVCAPSLVAAASMAGIFVCSCLAAPSPLLGGIAAEIRVARRSVTKRPEAFTVAILATAAAFAALVWFLRAPRHRDQSFHGIVITHSSAS